MPPVPSLRRSISALYVAQLSMYLVPLLTLPWLTRVLGPNAFGRLGFCLAVVNYFVMLADYGFNLSATRAIALHADEPRRRSQVFWNTLAVKALLASAGLPLLMLLTLVVPKLGAERWPLLVAYLSVAGSVLTPTWYFQGCERQATLSAISTAVRIAAVPLTFLLVRVPGDLPIAVALNAGCPVVAGLVCMGLLVGEGALERPALRLRELWATLHDGWDLFLSQASTSLYTSTNAVLLGLLSGPTAVGYYTAAERLTQAAQGMLGPINQSVYPRVSRLMQESRAEAFALIRLLLLRLGGFALLLSLLLFALAPWAVRLLYGSAYEPAIHVLRYLSPLPFIVGLSNVLGLHTMLPLGMKRSFSRILMLAGLGNIVLLLALAGTYGAAGAATSVVITELVVTLVMALQLWRRDVPIFGASAALRGNP